MIYDGPPVLNTELKLKIMGFIFSKKFNEDDITIHYAPDIDYKPILVYMIWLNFVKTQ